MTKYPRVIWNEQKLLNNARILNSLCADHIEWVPVTKSIGANIEIIASLCEQGYMKFADSRIENLKSIKQYKETITTYLLRIPGIHEVDNVVRWADYSFVSEYETIVALSQEADRQLKKHGIILMIELGDLREGMLPEDLLHVGERVLRLSSIDWIGIGTNLTCFGGVVPTKENLSELITLKQLVEEKLGHQLSVLSGGNSSSLSLILNQQMPGGINHLRLGESLFFGRETAFGHPIEGMHNDVFLLEAEIVEVKEKPSYPRGIIAKNAFGEKPVFEDKGIRRRAILALGEQDVPLSGLKPIHKGMEIVGGSSDHTILDVTEYEGDLRVGSVCTFRMDYKALLRSMTSSYVYKQKL
ncbi:putative amino acid racemase [Caldalkalibacillus uzonensis]|uniref:Amino acid racemase n=1 Tax=Caldalkalibacillus uzonensis TaxID=353224 RepID=A0ABU0CXV3_9BACI|nr:alanine/ornithine racemase family PLP-dependent enzyme [Caldalkalibacillus uzonensis]MDQ0340982.1 putative amino acid racemase [Caldalkalibacillus uzonensis]